MDKGNDEQFVQVWTLCSLLFLCFGLAFMVLASLTAMCVQRRDIVAVEQMKAPRLCPEALASRDRECSISMRLCAKKVRCRL